MKEMLLYGFLGGVMGSLYMGWVYGSLSQRSCERGLAVVDIPAVVFRKSQKLAQAEFKEQGPGSRSTAPKGEHFSEPTPSLPEVADQLKEGLRAFAETHHLILLPKALVVGGNLPDKTEEILDLLEKGEL